MIGRPSGLAWVVLAAFIAGCSRIDAPHGGGPNAARSRPPHTLRIGDVLDISTLNPHFNPSASLLNLSQMTMAYLVRYDARNMPAPELATSVPTPANGGVSKDGRSITYHLRRGVRWSDGATFDADDVVFSTRVVQNHENNEISRSGWDRIVKIDEPDKYTVVFHLSAPFASYLPYFFTTGGANPCVLPKHILAKYRTINNVPYNAKPVGIGPFRYVSWKRGDSVELERNPYYWRGRAKLDRITYVFIPDRNTLLTQLQTGEIDMAPYVSAAYYSRVRALKSLAVYAKPGYYFAHLDFNVSHPVLRDRVVRAALRLATDRAAILAKVNHGTGILQESMVSPASPWYRPIQAVPFDLARANALLDGAGWTRGADGIRSKDGRRLFLTFATVSGVPDTDQLIELVRTWWQQIGVGLEVRHYQPQLFFGSYATGGIIFNSKFDVTTFSWQVTPEGSTANLYASANIPPEGDNLTRYRSERADALFARLFATYDARERVPIITEIARTVVDDVPTVVLYVRDDIHVYRRELKNWHPNAVTPYDDMMNVDV